MNIVAAIKTEMVRIHEMIPLGISARVRTDPKLSPALSSVPMRVRVTKAYVEKEIVQTMSVVVKGICLMPNGVKFRINPRMATVIRDNPTLRAILSIVPKRSTRGNSVETRAYPGEKRTSITPRIIRIGSI